MFKRIIVAVDGSEHSNRALSCAKELAERFEASLWLVHAYPQTSDLRSYDQFEKLVARRKKEGQSILDQARKIIGEINSEINETLLEGPEAEAILSVAEIQKIDLILMGTRGLGSFEGILVGSVSQKVTYHSFCPVMLVP
ncbi:MAG: universal stress protein [Thermodesulfobacteriota bacterium]|nr:universal stress protein [Thermodesulfobacteriota bacterium]